MPMNLMGMGGAAGNAQAMETLFDQRMRAAALQQQDEHFRAQLAQQDALTRLKAQEMADATAQRLELAKQAQTDRQEAAKHLNLTRIDAQLKEIPTDTPISQPTVAGMTQAGIVPERFAPQPIQQAPPPANIAAPGQELPQPMPGTVANSPMPGRVNFTRIPTAQEIQHQQDTTAKAGEQDWKNSIAQQLADIKTGADPNAKFDEFKKQHDYSVAHPIGGGADKLTKVEHRGPDGRTIIEWLPKSALTGKQFEKGASAATESRLASAEAVTQTGNDIVASLSRPEVAAAIGPAMGRYSSLRDFLGDPPPEFTELAGQIESYAIANMGVHGMRSSAGADKIKALLDGHHTPESLAAGIKGLSGFSKHFMENEGRGKGTAGETPEQRKARIRKAAGL